MRTRNQQIIVLFGLASLIGCAGEEAATRNDEGPVGVAVDGAIDAASSCDAAPAIDAPEGSPACGARPSWCDGVVQEASACPTISICSGVGGASYKCCYCVNTPSEPMWQTLYIACFGWDAGR